MGGKKRRTKKDGAAAAAARPPPLNHHHQQQLQNHHTEHHSHNSHHSHHSHHMRHSSSEQEQEQEQEQKQGQDRDWDRDPDDHEMIDVTDETSGAGLHRCHDGRPLDPRLQEANKEGGADHHLEAADTLSPLPEIKTDPMDLDAVSVITNSVPLDPNGSQHLPLETQHANMLVPDPLEVDPLEVDNVSIFSPSHYPSVSLRFQSERPFDSNTITSSRSLWAEDLDYFWENGRRYCGNYFMPNDEEEQDRLRIVHQVFLSVFDLELTTVRLEDPEYILDIGTGTGEWAIGMGELYPECEVVGTDISAIQPSAVPHNVFFEIDDAELEWTRPENCADLIHMRHLAGAFVDWKFIYQQAFNTLKPGGYIELLDIDDHEGLRDFFSFFPADSEIISLTRDLNEAASRSGRPRGMVHLDQRRLIDIGFVDVTQTVHAIPLSPAEMRTGKLWLVACLCSLEALTLRLLTTYMGWSADRVRQACDVVAEELKDVALNDPARAKNLVLKARILVGRKPEATPGQCTAPSTHENGHVTLAESGGGSIT